MPAPARPNIILLMADQLRADYVGSHPASQCATPHLEALCGQHIFRRCVSVNPVCFPCRTALLTGRYSHQIHTLHMSGDLDPDIPTYPQALRAAGYQTFGIGKFHLLQGWDWNTPAGQGHDLTALRDRFAHWGFDEVWQVSGKSQLKRNQCDYTALLAEHGLLQAYRDDLERRGRNAVNAIHDEPDCQPFRFPAELYIDRVIGERALAMLSARDRKRPFFAKISFCGPHPPYDPPALSLARVPYEEHDDFRGAGTTLSASVKAVQYRKRQAYKAMIAEIDTQIGRLHRWLETEGLLDNTVVLFTSDHGEMMGDHGLAQKCSPYEASVRVPLYLRHPAFPAPAVHEALVANIDLTATILAVAGLDPVAALARDWPFGQNIIRARSLLPLLEGSVGEHREFVFAESYGMWDMVETETHKYVRWRSTGEDDPGREVLFDLTADPDEQHDSSPQPGQRKILNTIRDELRRWHERTPGVQTRWAPRMPGEPAPQ